MPKFTFGERLEPDDYWRRAALRIKRAAKIIGFPLPKVFWKWTDHIHCRELGGESFPLAGLAVENEKSVTIWIDLSRQQRTDTMLHEAAHAILFPVEDANSRDEHSPVFWALLGMLDKEYENLFSADGEDRSHGYG